MEPMDGSKRTRRQKGSGMKKVQGQPLPLGITVTQEKANFSIAVAEGKTCTLLLYHSGEQKPCETFEVTDTLGDVRYLALEDPDISTYEYNYKIDDEIVIDPYATALAGRTVWGAGKSAENHEVRGIISSKEYDWEGDHTLHIPYHKVVAYTLHVRGFTKDSGSKVKHKGTFEGIVEKLPYLTELGINQIQCMPVYEFDEQDRYGNYWGYGEAYYFAPKSAYSACGDGAKSLKDMVKACHKAGIEVVLEMPFSGEASGQMMGECLRYYMMEYHIDGFILNPVLAPMEAIEADPVLKKTKIMKHQTGFQDVMRRFLKGDEGMVPDVIYWLKHISGQDGIFNYITSHTGFTLCDLVSYDGKHNEANGERNQDGPDYNFSWNCGAEGPSRKKAVVTLRHRQVRNALFLTILAQGTPCLLAGDEFGNSQKGNNNVYCQDNPTGWVNWRKFAHEQELVTFVKDLIRIRKEYGVFCPEEELCGIDRTSCGVPDVSYHGENAWQMPAEVYSRQLGVYYSGAAADGTDCFVAYNMHWLEHTFALPSLAKDRKWEVIAATDKGVLSQSELLEDQKRMEVSPRTIVVLAAKKQTVLPTHHVSKNNGNGVEKHESITASSDHQSS